MTPEFKLWIWLFCSAVNIGLAVALCLAYGWTIAAVAWWGLTLLGGMRFEVADMIDRVADARTSGRFTHWPQL